VVGEYRHFAVVTGATVHANDSKKNRHFIPRLVAPLGVQEEMLLERTTLAITAGVSRRVRQMIQLMPQLSFLSSAEDSCSGNKS
jgi:hypothetical protein